jgi:predicted adenylyl cyclase CyaB
VKDPTAVGAVLAAALGVRGVVRKRRRLYLIGRTRVHLDQVEGLGGFIELEVVLGEGEAASQGEAVAVELMDRLGIARSDLVRGAYLDLLVQPPEGSPGRDGSRTTDA